MVIYLLAIVFLSKKICVEFLIKNKNSISSQNQRENQIYIKIEDTIFLLSDSALLCQDWQGTASAKWQDD